MKTSQVLLCVLGTLAVVARTDAQALYGSTSGGHGELYVLDPTTGGVLQDVGGLNDASAKNYSVTGLAFDPLTGVLYGSTGGASGTQLLTIDPTTGLVTVVGSFNTGHSGNTMTDLAFDPSGNLFGIGSSGGPNLYSINISTGQGTLIGSSGMSFTTGGGLAISTAGVFFGAPNSGLFGNYNPISGTYINIGVPNYPLGSSSSSGALAFSADGSTLYADNLASGSGTSELVTIDPATGNVTDIGPSVTHLDGIAFSAAPEPGTISLLLAAGAMTLLRIKRRK